MTEHLALTFEMGRLPWYLVISNFVLLKYKSFSKFTPVAEIGFDM